MTVRVEQIVVVRSRGAKFEKADNFIFFAPQFMIMPLAVSVPVLFLCALGKRICCTDVVSVLPPSTDRLLSRNM